MYVHRFATVQTEEEETITSVSQHRRHVFVYQILATDIKICCGLFFDASPGNYAENGNKLSPDHVDTWDVTSRGDQSVYQAGGMAEIRGESNRSNLAIGYRFNLVGNRLFEMLFVELLSGVDPSISSCPASRSNFRTARDFGVLS